MLYAVAFIPSFVMGGVTGIMHAAAPADYQYHDTLFRCCSFPLCNCRWGCFWFTWQESHFYWPKMFGTMLNEKLGKITFWLFLIGFHLTFFIQHFLRSNGDATSCIYISCLIKDWIQEI